MITPIFEDIQPGTDNESARGRTRSSTKETDVKSTSGSRPSRPATTRSCSTRSRSSRRHAARRAPTPTWRASVTSPATARNGDAQRGARRSRVPHPGGRAARRQQHYLNAERRGAARPDADQRQLRRRRRSYTPSGTHGDRQHRDRGRSRASRRKDAAARSIAQLKLWYLIPHMHRWGTNIKVDLTRAAPSTRICSTLTWHEQYTFHPPESRMDPSDAVHDQRRRQGRRARAPGTTTRAACCRSASRCASRSASSSTTTGIGSWACDGGAAGPTSECYNAAGDPRLSVRPRRHARRHASARAPRRWRARSLRGQGIAIEQYDRDFIIGRSWVAIYDSLKSRYPQLTWNRDELIAQTALLRDEVFAELGVTVLPGAREALALDPRASRARSSPAARASRSRRCCRCSGPRRAFASIVAAEDVARSKPAPDGYQKAMARARPVAARVPGHRGLGGRDRGWPSGRVPGRRGPGRQLRRLGPDRAPTT